VAIGLPPSFMFGITLTIALRSYPFELEVLMILKNWMFIFFFF